MKNKTLKSKLLILNSLILAQIETVLINIEATKFINDRVNAIKIFQNCSVDRREPNAKSDFIPRGYNELIFKLIIFCINLA